MDINGKKVSVDELIDDLKIEDDFLVNRGNDIFLSNNQIQILKRNNINYQKYNNLSSLIFEIEEFLNDTENIDDELDILLNDLSEINYYKNTNK